MTSIKLIVRGSIARAEVVGRLTTGAVGLPVMIEYDSAWDGLTKNLVCKSSAGARVMLDVGEASTVPHEVMDTNIYMDKLYVGVEGYNADGTLVIPTTWADCGKIYPGANSDADPSADPTLPVWAQLQAEIKSLQKNGVTNEQIEAAVESYLEKNPIEVPDSSQNPNVATVEPAHDDIPRIFLAHPCRRPRLKSSASSGISRRRSVLAAMQRSRYRETARPYGPRKTRASNCSKMRNVPKN